MVYLSRIYTKTGDQGETGLGNGDRVRKDSPRVTAYGSVDELNSVLGLVQQSAPSPGTPGEGRGPGMVPIGELLRTIQNDLFDVGADLCVPQSGDEKPGQALRITAQQVQRLEAAIDHHNEGLQPLRSFVLPGGALAAAWLHLARTVCRRAERDVVTLANLEAINPQVVIYLNRLSDLLFVLARVCNDQGRSDVLWAPGKTMSLEG